MTTETNFIINNMPDYSGAISGIASQLSSLNNTLGLVIQSLTTLVDNSSKSYRLDLVNSNNFQYHKTEAPNAVYTGYASWVGQVTTIQATDSVTGKVGVGNRVVGHNIDVNTFVSSVSGTQIIINKPTLGTPAVSPSLVQFYRN